MSEPKKCKKCNDTGKIKSHVKISDVDTWDYLCDCKAGKEWLQAKPKIGLKQVLDITFGHLSEKHPMLIREIQSIVSAWATEALKDCNLWNAKNREGEILIYLSDAIKLFQEDL